jgi:hypothetical protein
MQKGISYLPPEKSPQKIRDFTQEKNFLIIFLSRPPLRTKNSKEDALHKEEHILPVLYLS